MTNFDERKDIEEIENRHICAECIGEEFLNAQVEASGDEGKCNYCERDAKVITIGELADDVDGAFERHYYKTSTDPEGYEYQLAKEGLWERAGEPVVFAIAEAAQVDEALAEDVQVVLAERHSDMELAQMGEESPYDEDAHYEAKGADDIELQMEWRWFEQSIQQKSRFFSRSAMAVLETIFADIGSLKTGDGNAVVTEAGPDHELNTLFRARVFQTGADLENALKHPDQSLGPPPSRAASAGRMNPQGIAVFYGAVNEETAVAEVRPPVGSKVGVGRFKLLRPVKLLDVAALRDVFIQGSIFDPGYIQRLEHSTFLERLSHRFSQPVMPSDEPFEYLVTQAIAEYLSEITTPPLDGIIFDSAQMNKVGGNIVLFHPSARVQLIKLPAGADVRVHQRFTPEEDIEPDYWVWVEVPEPKKEKEDENAMDVFIGFAGEYPESNISEYDDRSETLLLDLESVTVHHIQAVKYKTHPYKVSRHTIKKNEDVPF